MKKAPLVADLLQVVHNIAPPHLAESWDNVGLQFGHPERPTGTVLVALEISTAVLDEAAALRAGSIVTHHPLLFKPPKSFAENQIVPALAARLIRQNHALIVAHTNLDATASGTNGELADRIGLQTAGRRFLFPHKPQSQFLKYVVFTPAAYADAITEAIHHAGAALIGNYSRCTFRTPGTGTFKPEEGANPHTGTVGQIEHTQEIRLETLIPKHALARVLTAVRNVHPYEEIAYDVYPLQPTEAPTTGFGLIGQLPEPTTLAALTKRLKKEFQLPSIGLIGDPKTPIQTVAAYTGSGNEAIREWPQGAADVLVTGEITHHDAHEAAERNLPVILLGHYQSEAIVCERLAGMISAGLKDQGFPEADVRVSQRQSPPLRRV